MAVPTFVDRVTLHVSAGRGGNGVASVHREKFKPLGGPDGGNGGPGGSVILRVDPDVTTLSTTTTARSAAAEHGGHGAGGHRNGAHGADLVLPVPDGTVVTDRARQRARRPGRPRHRAGRRPGRPRRPRQRRAGLAPSARPPASRCSASPATSSRSRLELKVVADIGLVGFPSAGKSSLIAAISRARPKIADYPFTTLVPNLGVVTAGDTTFTVADVPGLIEGASEGRGLGHDFLRHIERCAALVHVIDTATIEPGRNPVDDLDVIENELARYGGLEDRPRLVALNKIDVPDGRDIADMVVDDLRERGLRVFAVSAASGEGLRELTFAMAEIVRRAPAPRSRSPRPSGSCSGRRRPTAATTSPSPRPTRAGGCAARSPSAGCARPTSATTRPSASSPTGSTGSASRRGWSQLGAEEGDTVLIGHPDNAVVFDFKPGIDAGAEMLGRRGEDQRFDESRPAARPPPRDRRGAWTTAPRARPAPTWPAASTEPETVRARCRTRSARADDPTGPRTTAERRARRPTAAPR